LEIDAQAVEANEHTEGAARRSLEAMPALLKQGSVTYLDQLNAEQTQAQAIASLEQARGSRLAVARLYSSPWAVGGGTAPITHDLSAASTV
jgi:outer membrane protein TolC